MPTSLDLLLALRPFDPLPHPPVGTPSRAIDPHSPPRPGGSVSQCVAASGFTDYALAADATVTETENVTYAGGVNTGARHPRKPLRRTLRRPFHTARVQQAPAPCVRRQVLLVGARGRRGQPGGPTGPECVSEEKDDLVLL